MTRIRKATPFGKHPVLPVYALIIGGLVAPAIHGRSVAMTLTPKLVGAILCIEGNTDLPDQTIIEWEVFNENSFSGPASDVWAEEGQAVVVQGKYSVVLDLSRWPRGNLTVWLAFQPVAFGTSQPKLINELFGECGELLEDKNVSVVGSFKNMRRVELFRKIVWNPTPVADPR